MDNIKFPYRVKVNGVYYQPGQVIRVNDAGEYVKQGAEVVAIGEKQKKVNRSLFDEEPKESKRAGRPKKQ